MRCRACDAILEESSVELDEEYCAECSAAILELLEDIEDEELIDE